MSFLRTRRGVVLVGIAAVLALFLFRPGAARLKNRITGSISSALQRPVEVGSVQVRLLPRPGFDLDSFVVHDDPAFSAEPVLRAQEVTAYLRLGSLLRGRLEVSRLVLTEPSLNLVRNSEGHWNLESVLEHARQTPVAPTGARGASGRHAFPYIEADRGRINFKLGSEKKPFALTDADYALWQDSDSSWGMRLKAQPLRTDLNLSDTGTLRVNGTWQRADSLRNTPVEFSAEWEKAQLGQVTKLLSSQDRGWRGTVRVNVRLSGTPGDLLIDSTAALEDFRRYDIVADSSLALRTHCTAHYSSVDRGFHEVDCESPVGDGSLSVKGNIARVLAPPKYAFALHAEKVPMSAALALARHVKLDLPRDLRVAGTLDADLSAATEGDARNRGVAFAGTGSTEGLRLSSVSNKTDLLLDRVPFDLVSGSRPAQRPHNGVNAFARAEPESAHLVVGPFHPDHASPLTVVGWVWRQGYSFSVNGDSTVQHLLQSARTVGLPVPQPTADGIAKVDLQIAGDWTGFAAARITGSAQLKATRIELRGLGGPLEVASASVTLKPDRADVQNLSATVGGSHWTGSLSLPRPCAALPGCAIAFNLQADQLSTERISKFVNPGLSAPWYRFLTPEANAGPPFLMRLNAAGKFATNQLVIHGFNATHVTANLSVQNGLLRLNDLRGETLGGRHRGSWEVDFSAKPPAYTAEGTFEHVALAELAAAMHDDWITGQGNADYKLKASGRNVPELLEAASGKLRFDMTDGALKHVLVENIPLGVRRFSGDLAFRGGEFTIEDAQLDSSGSSYSVSGTASLSREVNFKLVHDKNSGLNITGTLEEPHVSAVHAPATEAALKH